ncbi:glycosyl hydrolase 53 family protein [Sediminibacillus albus]|uniref:Arabinogalactan endo-beta-1,4-galactanase n=1 Tax=Sediminibacillus albus TaxID=407036 RepID=A0A1G8Y3C8_9BACI|nr:glycosyl hydrolase 53 family protein [Sediminibacillus albus]SDJ97173.1 Arabinogalactan endo-1,4-beta-galactosidase [Sediminibacillus albus]
MKLGKITSLLLIIAMLLSLAPPVTAQTSQIKIKGGDFTMVPGGFSVLQFTTAEGVSLEEYSWKVSNENVVDVDSQTGRIDALGTGQAVITLNAVDAEGKAYQASSEVTVAAGAAPIVEPIPELQNNNRPDFMMGADVSSLYQIMEADKKFYDLNGQESHLFDVLEENGVNWVRLRVWNDPYDKYGNPYGGGNSNLDTTIALAKQAKQRDMKLFVTFHYSDFWAHPGQQIKPKEWSDLTGDELVNAVSEFTTESLMEMKEAGVYPNMVGIGNETNSDILEQQFNLTSEGYMNPIAVDIFKAGAAAVRNTDPNADDPENKALVSFHLANGNNTWLYNSFASALEKNNVDYDALGASYYPSWHGTYDAVLNNLNNITEKYGKYAFIAETAYPWTIKEDAGDDTPQNFKDGDVSTVGLAASVQGQATALREVINVAAKINNEKGLGAFYWEPAWLPGNTTGWAAPYGTGWEVAGLFDINGYALPSLQTFNLVRGDQSVPQNAGAYAYGWETQVMINKGDSLEMPEKISAVKNNGMMGDTKRTIAKQPVEWNKEDIDDINVHVPGEYIVFGSVAGKQNNAFAHVIIKEDDLAAAAAPTFSLPDGSIVDVVDGDGYSYSTRHLVEGGSYIELKTATPNAGIYFTLDGADPISGTGASKQLVGAPYIKAYDSIRTYAGPIQISQNVHIQAAAKRSGYHYVSGQWGSAKMLLDYSPIVSASYKAVYEYSDDLLSNGGFESGDLNGWKLKTNGDIAEVITAENDVTTAYAGDHAFKFSLAPGDSLNLRQKAKKLPDGIYKLSLYARGDNQTTNQTDMKLSAFTQGKEYSGTVETVKVPEGKMIWRKYSVKNIEVKNGNVEIRFDADTSESYTGYLDHVVLEKY